MKFINILGAVALMCATALCPNVAGAGSPEHEANLIVERGHTPRIVPFDTEYERNTVIIVTNERALYIVNDADTAVRFPIAVGKEGFDWYGEAYIEHKTKCPEWTPPKEMIERKPELARWSDGMPGCVPGNPLGGHAMYLFDSNGQDTLTRIHGNNDPMSIGTAASSGCFRMYNSHVAWLSARITGQPTVFVIANRPFEEGMSDAEMAGLDEEDYE